MLGPPSVYLKHASREDLGAKPTLKSCVNACEGGMGWETYMYMYMYMYVCVCVCDVGVGMDVYQPP